MIHDHHVDEHRDRFGPTAVASARLDATGRAAEALESRFDVARDGTLRVPCDDLEIVTIRR